MIRLGIIGLGTIYEKYLVVLRQMKSEYELVAVCDTNHARLIEQEKNKINQVCRFYTSVEELLLDNQVESVMIATPPKTHYSIAKICLEAGKDVLLEKPAVTQLSQLEELYCIANEKQCLLHIAYHAAYASDLEWYLEHREVFGNIRKIVCRFFDPYMTEKGTIFEEKTSLCGSFLDSAVNELSVCSRITDLTRLSKVFSVEQRIHEEDPYSVYASETRYVSNLLEVQLITGWNRGINHKETILYLKNSENYIRLDHSKKMVFLGKNGKEIKLWGSEEEERLVAQYMRVFREFQHAKEYQKDNRDISVEIHKLLFENY